MTRWIESLLVVLLGLGSTTPVAAATDRPHRDALFRSLHGELDPSPPTVPPNLGWWFGFRNGYQNAGTTAVRIRTLATTRREVWSHSTAGLIWGTAVIDRDGNSYVGSSDKVFYALSPTGQVRWTFTLPDAGDALIDSAATLTPNGLVIVPGGEGSLHALNVTTGERVWKFSAYHATDPESGVTVNSFEGGVTLGPDERLYAGSDNGYMYCIDLAGKELWHFKTGMWIWSSVAFDPAGEWLVFGSLDRHLYVLKRSTGELLARFKAGSEFKGSPAVDAAGNIYVGNSDYAFRRLVLEGKPGKYVLRERWKITTHGEIYSSPAVYTGRVVFGGNDGTLYCIASDGHPLWKYNTYSRISASPIITGDGVVLTGAKNGKVYAIDLESGQRLWSYQLAPGLQKVNLDASPALTGDGRIVVGSYNGRIYSLPAEFAAQHPGAEGVSLDPGPDAPQLGATAPETGAMLRYVDGNGHYLEGPPGELSPSALVTFKVIGRKNGELLANTAIAANGLRLEVTPRLEVIPVVGSDSYSLTVAPARFWTPGTTYQVKITGRYFQRTHPVVDLLKWTCLPKFSHTTSFKIRAGGARFPSLTGSLPRYSFRSLYMAQPEILDTISPAGTDGQAFIGTVLGAAPGGGCSLLLLPAYPRPDGVVLRAAPEKVFVMNGHYLGNSVRLEGSTVMSAMGTTIPFNPIRFFGSLTDEAIEDGQLHASARVWGIKSNGAQHSGVSWATIDDLADSRFQLQAIGTLQGRRLHDPAPPVSVQATFTDRTTLALTLRASAAVPGDHLASAVICDRVSGEAIAQASAKVTLTPGEPVRVNLGLDKRRLDARERNLILLLDGHALVNGP